MIPAILLTLALTTDASNVPPPVSANSVSAVEPTTNSDAQDSSNKVIVYKKDTVVDLDGSHVDGENKVPPAFFLTNLKAPNAASLLDSRLQFSLKKYNEMGF